MTIEDLLLIYSIVLEHIQYMALGPDAKIYNPIVFRLLNYFSLNFNSIYDFKFESFWIFYYCYLGFCSLSILMVAFTKFYRYFCSLNLLSNIFSIIFYKVLPIIANILFIPSMIAGFLIFKC